MRNVGHTHDKNLELSDTMGFYQIEQEINFYPLYINFLIGVISINYIIIGVNKSIVDCMNFLAITSFTIINTFIYGNVFICNILLNSYNRKFNFNIYYYKNNKINY